MSIKSIKTSKNNRMIGNSDVVARTKMFHTNRGWMASTSKSLQLGIAAGAAIAAGTFAVSNANADTVANAVSTVNANAETTKVSDSQTVTSQNITEQSNADATSAKQDVTTNDTKTADTTKAADAQSTTQDKTATASSNATSNKVESTTQDKASSQNTADANKQSASVKNDVQSSAATSSKAEDTTSNKVESTSKDVANNSNSTSNRVESNENAVSTPVENNAAQSSNASSEKAESTNNTVANDSKQSSEVKDENKSETTDQNKDNTVKDDKVEVTAPVTNDNASNGLMNNENANNASSDKAEETTDVVAPTESQKDSLNKDQAELSTSVKNTLDAVKNSTFYTEEQKKAIEDLITTGKTDSPENLPSNFMITSDGKVEMFIRGGDDAQVYVAVKDAEAQGPSLFANEYNQSGTVQLVGGKTHLTDDVFTSHMVITADGKTWDAWCLQPMAQGPFEATGQGNNVGAKMNMQLTKLDSQEMMDKYATLIGCAWYGYQGPASVTTNDDQGNLYTHLAMSVAAWDSNFANLRNYQQEHNQVTQSMIDEWRNIPQVKAILDKAKTFNADTMKNFNGKDYTFQAYDGHGLDASGNVIPNSQDLFSVQWSSTPIKPTITTTTDHKESLPVGDQVKISDKIEINNLQKNQDYKVNAQLVDKATGKVLGTYETSFNSGDSQSKTITAVTTVSTANVKEGLAWKTQLTPSDSSLPGTTHNDNLDDIKEITTSTTHQSIGTTATSENGSKDLDVGQDVVVNDKVHYEGLNAGEQYTVQGTLIDKSTGKAVQVNGKDVTASATFTAAEGGKGDVNVKFTIPSTVDLQGKDLVAFEKVFASKGSLVGSHEDINDEGQTVHVKKAEVTTTANNTTTGDVGGHNMNNGQQMQITDTVKYTNLVKGQQYTVTGTLMDKDTGKPVTVDGKEITKEVTFTATDENGSVDVVFTLPDDYSLQGHKLVAFEKVSQNGKEVAVHNDINSEEQTVTTSESSIHTTLTDTTKNDQKLNDNKNVPVGENIQLTDTVEYHGLVKGQTYVMNGTLIDKSTGKAVQVNGKDVTASTVFTATGTDGTVNVVFTLLDNIDLQGHEVVAFETLNGQNGKEIAKHEDINDKGQTVKNKTVTIGTELVDDTNEQTKGSHTIPVGDGIHLKDKVHYEGLQPGEQYIMTGTLMDKETGKAVQVNGKDVTESVEFTASETGNGDVEVHFNLPDDIDLQGHELVAFETLKTPDTNKVIAKHENWFDKNQTVKVGTPDLHTLATDKNNSHNVVAGKDTVIVDQVQYHNLVPGQKYTVKGTLIDKQTGKAVVDANGKPVTAEKTFIPETPNGTVSVEFHFDGTRYAGHQLVAFEDIYDEHGKLIERHEDINDLAETVNMIKPTTPQTGTSTPTPTPQKVETPQVGTPAPVVTSEKVETPVQQPVEKAPVVQEVKETPQVGTPAPAKGTPQIGEGQSVGLPQTGDSNESAAMLAAAGLIAGLGMAGLKKRKEA